MRLTRIELPAFGCLRGFEAELAPGLNLFHGLNEAGKSTLQQAVLALLYGFFDQDRARPDETARHERFRPWAGSHYHGLLDYELDDGRRFQVRRDFATTDIPTQLIDLTTGQDAAPQFGRGRHGNVPFARRHLGMGRTVFESCAFISQGEIFEVSRDAPREIGDAIASLADSARRDVSAANAAQRLDALIARIGSDRARTADLPRARERLRGAQQELQALDAARQALSQRAAERDQLQSALLELDGEIARHELLLCQARAADLAGRLGELNEADHAIAEAQGRQAELKPYAAVPHHLRDEVLDLRGRRQRISESVRRLDSRLERAALSEEDRLQYAALEAEAGDLTGDQIAALQALAYAPARARRGLRAALAGAARALAGAVAAALRALLRLLFRRRASLGPDAAPATQPAVTAAEAASLLEKHRRYLTLRPAVETLAHLQSEHAAAGADLAVVDGQLQGLLASAGLDSAGEDAVQAFLDACRRRQEYETALAAAQEAERRRRAVLQGRSPTELDGQRRQLEAQAERLLSLRPHLRDSQSDESPEALASLLDELRRQREQARLREAQLKGEIEQAFAQHRPRPEIEEEIERWQRETSRLERARAAAQMAKETIEAAVTAVYRDFAPRVNEFLSQGVEFVTEGRYRHAFVDPGSLKISLEVPEISQVLTDPPISHGTRTLVYVLMRIGLAQHMSSIHEPVPLVLDDPFVDIDSQRLPRLLEFLARLSQERAIQVLLFSKDEHTLHWFQESALEPEHRLHRLPALDEARLEPSAVAAERLI